MKKQTEKDRLTALYKRLSHDDERAGKSVSIRTKRTFVKGDFTQKMKSPTNRKVSILPHPA